MASAKSLADLLRRIQKLNSKAHLTDDEQMELAFYEMLFHRINAKIFYPIRRKDRPRNSFTIERRDLSLETVESFANPLGLQIKVFDDPDFFIVSYPENLDKD